MNKKIRLTGRAAAFGLTVSVLMTACSNNDNAPASNQPSGASTSESTSESTSASTAAPTITIAFKGVFTDGDRTNNPVLKELEKKTNTIIKVQEIPDDSFVQKLTLEFNSGTAPDLIQASTDTQTIALINNFGASGMLTKMTDLLPKMPNVQKFYDKEMQTKFVNADGNLYVLPTPRDIGYGAVFIRQDWLDNLGLKSPQTFDEYKEVLKQFATKDPDKDGIDGDTFGVAFDKAGGLEPVLAPFGVPNSDWMKTDDNKLVWSQITPGYKQAIGLARELVAANVADPEFVLYQANHGKPELVKSNKVGVYSSVSSGAAADLAVIQEKTPDAKLVVLNVPPAPGIAKSVSGYGNIITKDKDGLPVGFSSIWAVNSKAKADVLEGIARIFDFTSSDKLITVGVDGTDNTKSGDTTTLTKDLKGLRADGAWDVYNIGFMDQREFWKYLWPEATVANMNNTGLSAHPREVYFSTPTADAQLPQITAKATEIFTQIISGKMDLDAGWTEWEKQFKLLKGDVMTQEMNDRYAKDTK
ncbi:extracellular solute-binding protein [Paenibacillus lycopersici]|uniref:Extracellular solute-binding protein n=1 Tax=Paenibacillus lycopersici TaxID=2704462 RepID=A0A6C0FVH0_9BACL|nr:extracellular solute-binding protein [Paenibacillus lycopersici]QHT61138.1 extracellular solute-binding protein [Paenibacillus lycopersici]